MLATLTTFPSGTCRPYHVTLDGLFRLASGRPVDIHHDLQGREVTTISLHDGAAVQVYGCTPELQAHLWAASVTGKKGA